MYGVGWYVVLTKGLFSKTVAYPKVLDVYKKLCEHMHGSIVSACNLVAAHTARLKGSVAHSFVAFRKSGVIAKLQPVVSPEQFNSIKAAVLSGDDSVRQILMVDVKGMFETPDLSGLSDSDFKSDLIHDIPDIVAEFDAEESNPLQKYFKGPEFSNFVGRLKQLLHVHSLKACVENISGDGVAEALEHESFNIKLPISLSVMKTLDPKYSPVLSQATFSDKEKLGGSEKVSGNRLYGKEPDDHQIMELAKRLRKRRFNSTETAEEREARKASFWKLLQYDPCTVAVPDRSTSRVGIFSVLFECN